LTITRSENIKFYILAFLFAIGISESASYLIWFGFIEPFKYATIENPTPVMSHISYNPFLAFAIYLVLNELLSRKKMKPYERGAYTFFLLTMTFNMFITGGRAGQVMFFSAIVLLAFQYFKSSQLKAVFTSFLLIITIFISAYYLSPVFQQRVDMGYNEISNFDTKRDVESPYIHTSIGLRINFFLNSWEIFESSPIYGVGTGDFPSEYSKINKVNSPFSTDTSHPHNMYMLLLTQLGLIGFISLMSIFYYQIRIAISSDNQNIKNIGLAIPILFSIINWSDSYLLGHYTANLFILFSAFIYMKN
jgi:O-antigen ligase